MRRVVRALALVGGVAGLAALFTGVPTLAGWGTYRRAAVVDGEIWRLVTAMWVHLDWWHWLANSMALAGLILLGTAAAVPLRRLAVVLLVCGLAVTVALLRMPDVAWYAGLSGALHGLATWLGITLATGVAASSVGHAGPPSALQGGPAAAPAGAAMVPATGQPQRLRALGVGLCAGVLLKLWLEQSWLSPVAHDPAWGFGVVRVAHGLGAVSGGLWWCLAQWRTHRRRAAIAAR